MHYRLIMVKATKPFTQGHCLTEACPCRGWHEHKDSTSQNRHEIEWKWTVTALLAIVIAASLVKRKLCAAFLTDAFASAS